MIPADWRWLAVLNPMTMPVESLKFMFLGQGIVSPFYIGISIATAVLLLVTGVLVFDRVEKTFIDTV